VLVGDPACKVSALVQNPARDNGVVTTRAGTLDSSLVTLAYLPRAAVVSPGQRVVTSGLGKVFPAGISVGQIVSAHSVEFGLYIEAQVKLAANLGGLEQVWVLFP
jgi:rod shape-determining protein MreC